MENENYEVSSKPGQIEDFQNSQGHFLLVNLPINDEGTLNATMCLKSLHMYIDKLEQEILDNLASRNMDHGMDNMTVDPPVKKEK